MNKNTPDENSAAFNRLFEEFSDMLKFAVDNADKPITHDIPTDIGDKLTTLQKSVEEFCQLNQQMTAGQRGEGDPGKLNNLDNLSDGMLKIIERNERLKIEAEEKIKWLQQKESEALKRGETTKDVKSPNASQRQKQFKRFGLYNKWKHL